MVWPNTQQLVLLSHFMFTGNMQSWDPGVISSMPIILMAVHGACAPLPCTWGPLRLVLFSFTDFGWCLLSLWLIWLKAGSSQWTGVIERVSGRPLVSGKVQKVFGGKRRRRGIRAEWLQQVMGWRCTGSRDHPPDKLISRATDRWEAADLMLTSGNAEEDRHTTRYQCGIYVPIYMPQSRDIPAVLNAEWISLVVFNLGSVLLTSANWSII